MYHPFALAVEMAKLQGRQGIPTKLSLAQFEQFVLPPLISGSRGPEPKLDLPADDLATEDVQEQVQMALGQPLEIPSPDRRGQVGDIPGVQPIRRGCMQRARLGTRVRGPLGASMHELVFCLQYAVERGFGCQVFAAIRQAWDDLARWQVAKFH